MMPDVEGPGPADGGATAPAALAPSASAELGPGARVGRYVVLERVGAGGVGVVYAARDPELNRKTALKLLRPDQTGGRGLEARLRREAQAMARLAHPNVATVYDVGHHEGRVFVAMEFIEGPTLAQWLGQRARSARGALEPFLAAGRGLSAAHAAGLVHRDFKPQNVLVGDRGRVCVVDFGLARPSGGPRASGDLPDASPFETPPLPTRAGALAGSPAYLAPEQLRDEPADARSDQFSFCVALYEALYGEHPFAGATPGARLAAVEAGEVRPPPRGARVPRRLRRALVRGLAPAPERRFPSMDALLAELSRDPAATARRLAIATVVAASAAIGLGSSAELTRGPAAPPCRADPSRLAGAWGEARREEMRRAFAASGAPAADETFARLSERLDRYAADWLAMRAEACEGASGAGPPSNEARALQLGCLDRRRQALTSLTELFARADAKMVGRALEAGSSLESISGCTDLPALRARLGPPAAPAASGRVEAEQARLVYGQALLVADRLDEAKAVAAEVLEAARGLGHRPLEAEALFFQGKVVSEGLGGALALEAMAAAADAGIASGHDEVAARAVLTRARYEANLFRPDEAERWLDLAAALVERLEHPFDLEEEVLTLRSYVLYRRGRFEEALEVSRRDVAMLERAGQGDDLRASYAWNSTGIALSSLGRFAEAADAFGRAIDIRRRVFGPRHSLTSIVTTNLAEIELFAGHPDRALALAREAADAAEQSGARYPLAYARWIGALAERDLGRAAAAREAFRATLDGATAVLGDGEPALAAILDDFGDFELAQGRAADAERLHARGLALRERSHAPPGERARSLAGLAEAGCRLRKPGCVDLAERADAAAAAAPPLEQGRVALHLARALWAAGGDRARARVMAERAEALFERAHRPALAAEARRWRSQPR
jgi:tetratricopeptide (TPR) repeat protein/predicted Ser/Thr protein kinase